MAKWEGQEFGGPVPPIGLLGRCEMAKALQNMNEEEFMTAWDSAGEKFTAAKERLREFKTEHNRRLLEEEAERVLANMDDSQLAALAQRIEAKGIESAEAVGEM